MPFPADTILLLHPPKTSPYDFLSRLLGREIDEDELVIPWTIDNKYYTAEVNIQILELEDEGVIPSGVEVLLYIFDRSTTIPYALTSCMASEPKDIALAVKVFPHTDTNSRTEKQANESTDDGDEDAFTAKPINEDWQEMFEELGMEVIDETAQPEEDDERPISPLETVRQTLMTHLWRGMKRKPVGNGRAVDVLPASRDLGPYADADAESDEGEGEDEGAGPSTFPVAFNGETASSSSFLNQKHGLPAINPGDGMAEAFPGLAELKAQIEMDEFDRFERTGDLSMAGVGALGMGMGRLGMLDELLGSGPGDEEYARLDEWLDGDDEEGFMPLQEDAENVEGEEGFQQLDDSPADDHERDESDKLEGAQQAQTRQRISDPNAAFDDDFDDFAAFQSAPTPAAPDATRTSQGLSMDPTPLLYHLQSVRAELAGLSEEERRIRAAKEVSRVMKDLGFDDADVGLFDDDDEDELKA